MGKSCSLRKKKGNSKKVARRGLGKFTRLDFSVWEKKMAIAGSREVYTEVLARKKKRRKGTCIRSISGEREYLNTADGTLEKSDGLAARAVKTPEQEREGGSQGGKSIHLVGNES